MTVRHNNLITARHCHGLTLLYHVYSLHFKHNEYQYSHNIDKNYMESQYLDINDTPA